ncbi:TRAP transporter substrate-binding protein [Oceanispirochaeta sp.]|uniref:TRAP transporter substrate-binding protein n=1 Tax=Oceanispirochaeta sp. TaxID=2035350 RepID=UPI002608B418|nr:TRAP transporter substrate-binding protein [Oceanispirochaeta sp.]MDA3956247.1 TRAP transporter substrate-binding protein [Oceanispirochaeta sp.]
MRKGIVLFTAILMIMSTMVWANGQSEEVAEGEIAELSLTYAELNPDGHPLSDVGYYFADKVAELSGGAMKIQVFTSGILGSEKESMQALQVGGGSIDMFRGNTNSLSDYNINKLTLFSMPYTFRDRAHLWSVLESEIGVSYLSEPQEVGSKMVALFYTEEGARNFFTSDPMTGMADLKGRKMRVPKTQVMTDTVKALGIEPTPIDWGELYSSLSTGVVDGAEQPFAGYYSNKFYEVSPYYILDGHTYSPGVVLMSEAVWNEMSKAQQDVLMEAAAAAQAFCKKNAARVDEELISKIREVATVIEVKNIAEVQATTESVVNKYIVGLEDEMAAIKAK